MEKEKAIELICELMNSNAITKTGEQSEALETAVHALRFLGCGCDICLLHNRMTCPKLRQTHSS